MSTSWLWQARRRAILTIYGSRFHDEPANGPGPSWKNCGPLGKSKKDATVYFGCMFPQPWNRRTRCAMMLIFLKMPDDSKNEEIDTCGFATIRPFITAGFFKWHETDERYIIPTERFEGLYTSWLAENKHRTRAARADWSPVHDLPQTFKVYFSRLALLAFAPARQYRRCQANSRANLCAVT